MTQKMRKEELQGGDLKDLTRTDFIRYGVTKFSDVTKMLKAIQTLGVNQQEGSKTNYI